jgi:protein-tyrosine phosphatase
MGFTAVALCAVEHQPGVKRFPGLNVVVSVPLHDGGAMFPPTEGELMAAMDASGIVSGVVADGGKVLVTCNMGYNRSGLVTALSLMRLQRSKSTDSIIADIRAVRPGALSNPYFADFLRAIDRKRLGGPYQRRRAMPKRARAGTP